MKPAVVFDFANVFFAGILSGALVSIDIGLGRAVPALVDEASQIQVRQALIRSLVSSLFVLTILTGIAVTVLNGVSSGFGFRLAGLVGDREQGTGAGGSPALQARPTLDAGG